MTAHDLELSTFGCQSIGEAYASACTYGEAYQREFLWPNSITARLTISLRVVWRLNENASTDSATGAGNRTLTTMSFRWQILSRDFRNSKRRSNSCGSNCANRSKSVSVKTRGTWLFSHRTTFVHHGRTSFGVAGDRVAAGHWADVRIVLALVGTTVSRSHPTARSTQIRSPGTSLGSPGEVSGGFQPSLFSGRALSPQFRTVSLPKLAYRSLESVNESRTGTDGSIRANRIVRFERVL